MSSVGLTLRVKLCGRGPRAEADPARRLPPLRLMRCGRRAAARSRELTRRFSAGPKPGRISFYAELGGELFADDPVVFGMAPNPAPENALVDVRTESAVM